MPFWGTPDVDLMASKMNAKVPSFVSRYRDPQAIAVDALVLSWNQFHLSYLFPPLALLPRVIKKIKSERVPAILIAPDWPRRTWYADLGRRKGCAASKSTLARWIRATIQEAYRSMGMTVPAGIKAHSTRAVGASWAVRHQASAEQCQPPGSRSIHPQSTVLCPPMSVSEKRILRYRYTKRLTNDHDQQYDLAVIVATNDPGNNFGIVETVFNDAEVPRDLRGETTFGDLWLHDFWGTKLSSNASHKSYRPLTVLTFRVSYALAGGLHPVGFHVINIILHCMVSVLMLDVFSLLFGGKTCDKGKKMTYSPKAALLSALLFAVHPVHTECVAGIVGRADLLCALFVVLSFLGYSKAQIRINKEDHTSVFWVLCSIALAAIAMLCKEQGITVLGLNAVFDVFVICKLNMLECIQKVRHRDKTPENFLLVKKGLLSRISLLAAGGICMLYLRWSIMGTGPPAFTNVDNPASFAETLLIRVINYNYYYSLNGWLLLCPWWLCFDWSMGCIPLIKSLSDSRIMAPAALWFCLFGLMYQALFSSNGQTRRILTMGLGFLIIPFLPASNLFFRVGFVVAERVLYLPSVGYCILLSYGYCKICKHVNKKKLATIVVLGLLTLYPVRCIYRSNQWKSEELLFKSALDVCPLNAKVHYNIGKNLADRGLQADAIKYYREAIRLNQKYVHAMNNLGNILKEKGELHEAEELLSRAVSIQSDFSAAWMNLGIVQNSLKRFEDAEKSYLTAIRYRKKYPDCYYNLGRLFLKLNNVFVNLQKTPKTYQCKAMTMYLQQIFLHPK
ncbi:unnamed protein product [Ranitomeya imitator]|uniref:dolichyl-phosphate-mannose--protein mannosyltransferase n=1 Tax=Ranitomeya imitator TaxID=111125 RepID=A0ABN9MVN8_9NEOB|nr:unnamed protein product [Ranitomeya imitator]